MNNLKKVLVFFVFGIIFSFSNLACAKQPKVINFDLNSTTDLNEEPPSCMKCIFADARGMLSGALAGSALGGPIGGAILGAAYGAYDSVNAMATQPDEAQIAHPWEDEVTDISEYDYLGDLHNRILDAYLTGNLDITNSNAVYSFIVNVLDDKNKLNGFNVNRFRDSFISLYESRDSREEIPQKYTLFLSRLQEIGLIQSDSPFRDRLSSLIDDSKNDNFKLMAISTIKYSHFYWN